MQISKYTTKNFFDAELVKIKYGTVPFIMVFMFFCCGRLASCRYFLWN